MMRRLLMILVVFLSVFSFSITHAATPKNWTFIIYLNGDNNLDDFGTANLKAMEQIGSNDQVNIVVQWASLSAGKAVRMLIQKSTDSSRVTSPVIQDMGLVDMGDYHNLQDFIQWAVQNYPAQHYFVDIWNHGSGWHKKKRFGITKRMVFGDISWDDNSGHSISTEQLGQAMAFAARVMGHKVDLYGSDACLMAMAEIANEMSDSVNVFAGSQEVEPGEGWPYADLLSRWEATPNATADQVAKILTDVYVKSYQGGSNGRREVTFSAFDLNKLSNLNRSMAAFSESIRKLNASDRAKVLKAAKQAQSFEVGDYGDLLDFVKHISSGTIKPEILQNLQQAANQLIIANAGTSSYSKATGLSIWLPTSRNEYSWYSNRYQGMKFSQETQWGETLSILTQGA